MSEESLKINEAVDLLLDRNVTLIDAEAVSNTNAVYHLVGYWDEKKEKFIIELELA
jgi:hypothetical protein